ncbi:MAG: metallophosphoesterase, partial [Desulfobacteraceae bacterium]
HLEQTLDETLSRDVDVLIIGGDIVPHNLPQAHAMGMLDAQAMYIEGTLIPGLQNLKAKRDVKIFLDFGNDDFLANRPILEQYQGKLLHLMHLQKHPLTREVDLVGYMMVPPTPFQRKDWERPDAKDIPYPPGSRVRLKGYITGNGHIEETVLDLDDNKTIEKDLALLSGRIDRPFIFVAHCPPFDTPLDMLSSGVHVGSIAIRRFIEKWSRRKKLVASLHGHIHESPRVSKSANTRINGALSINPGQDRDLQYVLLDLPDGAGPGGIQLV